MSLDPISLQIFPFKFKFNKKLLMPCSRSWYTDHYKILHMTTAVLQWYDEWKYSKINFQLNLNDFGKIVREIDPWI